MSHPSALRSMKATLEVRRQDWQMQCKAEWGIRLQTVSTSSLTIPAVQQKVRQTLALSVESGWTRKEIMSSYLMSSNNVFIIHHNNLCYLFRIWSVNSILHMWSPHSPIKISREGTSLVTQWLRIRLPMQGTWVRSLVGEDPTCRGATRPVSHNYWACALEPSSRNYWAHMLQLLKPTGLEPVLHNRRSHLNENPAHPNKE